MSPQPGRGEEVQQGQGGHHTVVYFNRKKTLIMIPKPLVGSEGTMPMEASLLVSSNAWAGLYSEYVAS